jgi:dienelactone hydrolase
MRVTNEIRDLAVICINGGQARPVEGTWSASLEWLVAKLAKRLPDVAFAEVRYRIKSWNRMDLCVQDTLAAVESVTRAGSERCVLLGFSMGGAVAIGAARHASVSEVVGLAPWIPDRLDLSGLRDKRFTVFHGSLDRYLPGIPGVSPTNSRRGFERAQAQGVEGSYSLIPGALHGIALRAHWGMPIPLPRAGRWAELVGDELERARDKRAAAAAA